MPPLRGSDERCSTAEGRAKEKLLVREHFKQLPDVEEASDEEGGSGSDDEGSDEVRF